MTVPSSSHKSGAIAIVSSFQRNTRREGVQARRAPVREGAAALQLHSNRIVGKDHASEASGGRVAQADVRQAADQANQIRFELLRGRGGQAEAVPGARRARHRGRR